MRTGRIKNLKLPEPLVIPLTGENEKITFHFPDGSVVGAVGQITATVPGLGCGEVEGVLTITAVHDETPSNDPDTPPKKGGG